MKPCEFGVFFDPTKTTSGQRFYKGLCAALKTRTIPLDQKPGTILFNISAPFGEIVKAKMRGQKVVLRVDGLWWDRISPEFLEQFTWPTRKFIRGFARFRMLRNLMTEIANFIYQNYTGFLRIVLANHIVYQTNFCMEVHQRYFPQKKYSIIGNSARLISDHELAVHESSETTKICMIYSDAPFKGVYEAIKFVEWLNEVKKISAKLYIVGFNGEVPQHAPDDMLDLITNSEHVVTYPAFGDFNPEVTKILSEAHCCLCFSYRDPCPNAVVESMAHGLPVVGIASGGVPEIVCDAGELIDWDDWKDGYFAPQRYEFQVKDIDFEQVFLALTKVLDNLETYRKRVRQRFADDLDVDITAEKYAKVLEKI